MARRRHRGSSVVSSEDTTDNSSAVLDSLLEPLDPLTPTPDLLSPLDTFVSPVLPVDGRQFTMDMEPARGTPTRGHQVLSVPYSPSAIRADTNRLAICVRRKERREVLFAFKKAGRGGGKPRKLSWRSDIKC